MMQDTTGPDYGPDGDALRADAFVAWMRDQSPHTRARVLERLRAAAIPRVPPLTERLLDASERLGTEVLDALATQDYHPDARHVADASLSLKLAEVVMLLRDAAHTIRRLESEREIDRVLAETGPIDA